jgi:hypothetical protein
MNAGRTSTVSAGKSSIAPIMFVTMRIDNSKLISA